MSTPRPRTVPLDLDRSAATMLAIQAEALSTVGNHEVGPAHLDAYRRHAGYPGFRGVGLEVAGRLVGFTYGHVAARGQWWRDEVAPRLRRSGLEGWLDDAYVLVELHVLPQWHGQGLGPRLLEVLLGEVPQRRLLLSTDDSETPARRLYRRLGCVDLMTGFHFSSTARPFAIMGGALPLRAPEKTPAG